MSRSGLDAHPTRCEPLAPRSVRYIDLPAQYAGERAAVLALVDQVFASGRFLGGEHIERLEQRLAARIGVKYCRALDCGTDALVLALLALGIGSGDEVITAPNSFLASAGAIVETGARPVFADVRDDQNIDPAAIEAAIGPRTRAIMPVHLTGRMADMPAIRAIADRHGLAVVEDAAQAIDAHIGGRRAGAWSDIAAFSAHPVKNLNAAGDAGFVVSDDAALIDKIAQLRSHGLVDRDTALRWGRVSRMDSLQAAILNLRLDSLDRMTAARQANAALYLDRLDPRQVFHAPHRADGEAVFHTFVVQVERRDDLRLALAEQGIGAVIHYPLPIHLQPAAAELGYRAGDFPIAERQAGRILSLPVHPFLDDDDIAYVAAAIDRFFAG